jgi:LETM1 and EF-hand domain-containing protein 1
VIVLVLEEVIPLIVLYAPGMLPSTCILASQRARIDANRREKQRAYAETMRDAFLDARKAGSTALASWLPSTTSSIELCGKVNFGLCWVEERSILFSVQSLVSVDVGSRLPA